MELVVLTVCFCEIIHDGMEWREVHSGSTVKENVRMCVGAVMLDENGHERSDYLFFYLLILYFQMNMSF